jgi:hypothetical protein
MNSFSVVGAGIFLFLAFATMPTNNNRNSNSRESSANTTTYISSRAAFSGKLADNYVDFSFRYANSWKRDPKAGTAQSSNFVKVEKTTSDGTTIENFAVGYFSGQRALMEEAARELSDQFSRQFSEYSKFSEGKTQIGPYDGYEFRFTSKLGSGSASTDLFGRIVLLPGDTGRQGATLLMLATPVSGEILGPNDVGEKGELPIILKSFRFGQ